MENEFMLKIIAYLNKQLTKKSINGDLRTLDNTMYVRVLAKLSKTLARRQLKSQLKELNDLYVKVGANISIDRNAKAQLQKNIMMLQQSIADLEIGLKASKYQQNKINAEIKSIRNKVQQDAENNPISFNLQVKKEKLLSDIEYLGKRYSKLFSNVSATQKYEKLMSNAFNVSDKWQLADVRTELSAFTSELKANGLATQSTADKWKTLVERSKDLFSAATLVRVIFSQIRQSVSTFLELDTAMTNVWKVSDDIVSREQFSGLLTKWNKLAQDLSVTTTSLINSVSEWSKIGFDLDMSEQLAELTTIFEKTAEISNDLANKTLVSTAQAFTEIDGFGEEDYVERVEAIGNKINAIGNKYAISSEGISEALQNSSAALVMANNDLDEAISMITTGNKIFQSPEEMGNTLKVVSARLRGQKGELEALGEDTEGMIESVSKVQTQILNLTDNKVNIFERDNETLKSTYDILLEVGKVYDSLSDKDQAELTEIMFGKQRMSAGSSLLLNYEELEQVKNDSINASNSMAEEYAKYMESAEASITTFKEKLIETYSAFMSGDMIKFAADTGSAFLDLANSTDLLRHSLLAVVTINLGKGISTVGAVVASTAKQMNTLGSALEQVKNLPLDKALRKNLIVEIGKSTKDLTEKNLELLLSQKQLNQTDRITILQKQNLTIEEAKAKLAKMQLTSATNSQSKANVQETATTLTLSGAMASLKTSIKGVGLAIKASFLSNPIGWVLTGITTAVSIASTVMDAYNQKMEETREKFEGLKTEVSDIESELSSLNSQLETTNERMKELEGKDTLTFTEKEEYDNLVKQNNELQRTIDLLELEQKTRNAERNKAFVDTMKSDVQGSYEYAKDEFGTVIEGNAAVYSMSGASYSISNEKAYIEQQFGERAKLLEEKRNAETKEEQDRIQEQIDEIDFYLQSKSTQWSSDASGISYISEPDTEDEKAVNEWLDFIADYQDKMAIMQGGTNAKENTFNRLVDNWVFDETLQGLQDLGEKGKVTADMLADPKYDEFIAKLVELGVIDSADNLEDIALAFNKVTESVDDVNRSIASFNISAFTEEMESYEEAYSKLTSAQEEYLEAGSLSVDTFADLQESGLLEYLQFTSEGLTINKDKLLENAQASKDKAVADLHAAMMSDMLAIAIGDTSNISETAQSVIAQLGNNAEIAGEQALSSVANWATLGDTIATVMEQAKGEDPTNVISDTQTQQMSAVYDYYKNLAKSVSAIDISTKSRTSGSGSSSSAKNTTKDLKEVLEAQLNLYEAELNAGLISFDDFLNKSRSMIDEYYRDGKISAADYWSYVEDLYKQKLSVLDKALSAVTRRIDKEIDGIKDIIEGIEKQNDALNKQKDEYDSILSVVEDVYDTKIESIEAEQDAIQDTIDKLQEENDEKQRQIDLEKARWQLYQSLNNRSVKLFNGREFVYTTNRDEVRDAQQNLADLELEETISGLEKEKEALNAEIEKLEEFKQKWQEVANVYETEVNKQLAIALWGKNYEEMILSNRISDIEDFKNNYVSIQKQINNNQGLIDSYNEKIVYYEALKEQWSSIADAYENAQADMLAAQIFGADWETKVLSGRLDILNTFKNNYIATQQAMADAAVQSANAQIQAINAVAEAQKNSGGSTIESPTISNDDIYNTVNSTVNNVVDSMMDAVGNVLDSFTDSVKKKTSGNGGSGGSGAGTGILNKHTLQAYGTGTDNAKPGVHVVSEKGDEIIIDNHDNVLLAKGKQLHLFEGGETVIKSSETSELLKNQGNLIPVQSLFANIDTSKLMENMPHITPNINMPKYDFTKMNHNVGTTISIGDIHLHEVQNVDSFADAIVREFPNRVIQAINKR